MVIQYQTRRFYPDLYGGIEVWAFQTVRAIAATGESVSVMAENYGKRLLVCDEPLPGVSCYRIPTAGMGWLWRIPQVDRVGTWTYYQRRYSRADVVLASYAECVISSKLAWPRRPVIYKVHGVSGEGAGRLQLLMERQAARLANVILVGSEVLKRDLGRLVHLPESKIRLVRNGVDHRRFAEATGCKELQSLKAQGCRIITYVGRLHWEKGVDLVLDAFSRMELRGRAVLVLAGDGPERRRLDEMVSRLGLQSQVVFLGKVQAPETVLAASDVMVLPSRRESFGNVLLEAMAAGVPCVAWRSEFPRVPTASSEIIVDGVTGLCPKAFDTEEMAKMLQDLLSDEERRKSMGRRAQEIAKEKYPTRLFWQPIVDLAEELTGKHA